MPRVQIQKPWDEFQAELRESAPQHSYEVKPDDYLPLDQFRTSLGLRLFRPGGGMSVADFYPIFEKDKTQRKIGGYCHPGHGVENFLRIAGLL